MHLAFRIKSVNYNSVKEEMKRYYLTLKLWIDCAALAISSISKYNAVIAEF